MVKQIIAGGVAVLSLSLLTALSVPSTADAATCTFDDGGTGLQGEFDGITVSPTAGVSSTDVTTDCLDDLFDSAWSINGAGTSIGAVIEDDDSVLSFGIYDATDSSNKVELLSAAIDPGDSNGVQLKEDGSVWVAFADTGIDFATNKLGYYVEIAIDVFLYSDSSLNPDDADRMYAYLGNGDTIQVPTFFPGIFGPGEWILVWDTDQAGEGDGELDFDDFMIIVESSHPHDPPGSSNGGGGETVPEPTMLILVGLGLVGIGLFRRRPNSA